MEYIYAALLLHKLGKEINEDNIKAIIKAAGVTPDDAKIKVLVSALQGVNIDEAIQKGLQATAVVATSAAPVATGSGSSSAPAKEEKKEEKREEENLAGLSALFG